MSKFVGTGTSSYEKRIYRATVSQKLRNTALGNLIVSRHVNELVVFYGSQNSLLTQMTPIHTSSKFNDIFSHLCLDLKHDIRLSIFQITGEVDKVLQYCADKIY